MNTLPALLVPLALQAPVPPLVGSPAPVEHSAKPFEIVRTWTGDKLDHLGIGLSSLGDVDGDGRPDFILGSMTGAYTFYFGPGAARVVSGKDGSTLYTVRGTNKEGDCGDAYGDTIRALGDLDRDGVPDFAVGAWRYEEYVGYVAVYSGKNGAVLATLYGDGRVTRGEGPVPPTHCEWFAGKGFGGSITALGDVDGDSVPDFAVGTEGDCSGSTSFLVSGRTFEMTENAYPGIVLGRTGDLDGDGRADVLCLTGSRDLSLTMVSGATRKELAHWPIPGEYSHEKPVGSVINASKDVDGDGFLDVVSVESIPPSWRGRIAPAVPLRVRWISGKTGQALHMTVLEEKVASVEVYTSPLDDVDGDGSPDVFVQAIEDGSRAKQWVLGSSNGRVLATCDRDLGLYEGRRVVPLGALERDGSAEYLVSDYESAEGAHCGGAVHLCRLRIGQR